MCGLGLQALSQPKPSPSLSGSLVRLMAQALNFESLKPRPEPPSISAILLINHHHQFEGDIPPFDTPDTSVHAHLRSLDQPQIGDHHG